MDSPSGSSSQMDLARLPPVQYSAIAKDYHSKSFRSSRRQLLAGLVSAGFNGMTKKSDKHAVSHVSAKELSARRAPKAIGNVRSLYVCAATNRPFCT